MAAQETEHPSHHLRPVARRLPVGRRASGGAGRRTPMRSPREGVLFRRHYAGAAPCSPARACLYTGLYQMNNRVCRNGTPLDARHGNIALAARRLGYDPTLFGYTDVAPDPRHRAPGDPLLKSYEGVLPGFTRAPAPARAPEAMAVLAGGTRRRLRRRLSRHPPPAPRASARRDHQRAAGLFRRTRRRPPSWPASSSAGSASRTRARPGSRISPSSARIRPSSCRSPTTRCTIRPTARPSAALARLARGSRSASLSRLRHRQAEAVDISCPA